MPKVSPNYALMKRLLTEGWNGEEFRGSKEVCASLLLCVLFDPKWIEEEFKQWDFHHTLAHLRADVTKEFVLICLAEMAS
jgi:hypothetical protein